MLLLASGSMVTLYFVWYFSPGRAKNTRQKVKIRSVRFIDKETAMIQNRSEPTSTVSDTSSRPRRLTRGLQAALWTLWTLAVVSAGAWGWRADMLAGRPMSLFGMAINAILVGVIGLIVLTIIEMRLEPWRFLD